MTENKTLNKVRSLLTEDVLFEQTRQIIEESLTPKYRDSENFIGHLTIGQFKKLDGWQGSEKFLTYCAGVFVARLCRMATLCDPSIISHVPEILEKTILVDEKVGKMLKEHFSEKYGQVPNKRVKELDEMIEAWYIQDKEQFDDLANTGQIRDLSI